MRSRAGYVRVDVIRHFPQRCSHFIVRLSIGEPATRPTAQPHIGDCLFIHGRANPRAISEFPRTLNASETNVERRLTSAFSAASSESAHIARINRSTGEQRCVKF
jgi:hypothetical protein